MALYILFWVFDVSKERVGLSVSSIIDAFQVYRFITSAFTHGGILHILSNMCYMLLLGISVENHYGTIFYAILNLFICLLGGTLSIIFYLFLIYVWPISLGGGGRYFEISMIGYSGVIFGLVTIFSTTEPNEASFFGFKVKKVYIPFIMLVLISVFMSDVSFMGHFSGIIAALLIKYGGLFLLLPRYSWI